MKRVLLLLAVLTLCGTVILASLILLPGTGAELALRLDNSWRAGELIASQPRMTDIDTVSFDRMTLRSGSSELALEDVEWQRGALFAMGRELDVVQSRVAFQSGSLTFDLSGRWGDRAVWPGLDDVAEWWLRLPREFRGERLDMVLRAPSEVGTIELATTASAPRFEQGGFDADGELPGKTHGSLRAELESPMWGGGEIEWRFGSAGSRFRLLIDDGDLARFPFAELARVFDFPWPVDLPAVSGWGDLDWSIENGASELRLLHYQVQFRWAGLPHVLRHLTGGVTMTSDTVAWDIEGGRYSQSRLSGNVSVDRRSRRVTGDVQVTDVLGDRRLGVGLPGPWYELLQRIPLTGRCDVKLSLDGLAGMRPREIVSELVLEFASVALRSRRQQGGASTSGLEGNVTLRPVTGGWKLQATTGASTIHGFHIPAAEWRGTIDSEGLRIDRVADEGEALVTLRCWLDGEIPRFSIYLESFPLAEWFGRDLGVARGSLSLTGSWDRNRGFSFDGWCSWAGLTVPTGSTWPFRRARGPVSGYATFRRYRGQDYVPSISARDEVGIWVARGWIDRDRRWTLEGAAVDHAGRTPTPVEIPNLVEDPREGWHAFRLQGPFFEWRPTQAEAGD